MTAHAPFSDPKAIDLLDVSLFTDRREHEAFDILRENNPVHFNVEDDGPGFYALTRFDHIQAVAQKHVTFCSGQGTQIKDKRAEGKGHPSVHNADPPIHSKLRRIVMPPLRRSAILGREQIFRRIIGDLIDATPRGRAFEFVDDIAVKIPMIIFAEVLGVGEDMHGKMVEWANTMSDIRASEQEQATARQDLFQFFRDLVAEKRKSPSEDLASVIAQATIDGLLLNEEQLDAYFMVLTVAGNETTRNLLSGGLEALCQQQADLARLIREPELLNPAIEEMLRWVSPVMQMRRTATEDQDLFGVPIKKGTKVVLYFNAGNRDPRTFDAPQTFKIDRKHNPHMGFGTGPHFCLGAHLARIETKIFYQEFARRFTQCNIEEPGKRLPSNWFAGTQSLKVTWS